MSRVDVDPACRDVVEIVTDHLAGALGPVDGARLAAHLAECPDCARYVEQIRLTAALIGRVGDDDLPAEAWERLRGVLERHLAGGDQTPGPG